MSDYSIARLVNLFTLAYLVINITGDVPEKPSCGCSTSRGQCGQKPNSEENSKYSSEANTLCSSTAHMNKMSFIPAGKFLMGTNRPVFVADGEGPEREVEMKSFYMDIHEVNNAEFEKFVNATGYVTEVKYDHSVF